MDLPTDSGFSANTVIAAPAGNLEKLRMAVAYGADEVYFGGRQLNLRSQAGNLATEDIAPGIKFSRENGVRTTFLLNSFLHEEDIKGAREYIAEISHLQFDAFMISDPGMLILLKEAGVQAPVHLSTQMSTLNHLAVKFWKDAGIERIVLGREATINEIRKIRSYTDAEIEIFCHGALCISYSGRCLLSRFLTGRDANLGSCTHPCRWRYSLVEEKRPGAHLEIIEHARGTEILSSKDLCLLGVLPEYIEAGVNVFKIEGRMKSLYYTAGTTRIYKHALQVYYGKKNYCDFMPFWLNELDLVSHRPYTHDLFNEFDNKQFGSIPYIKKALFLGYWHGEGLNENEALVKAFNPIYLNEEIEAIFPIVDNVIKDCSFRVVEIKDEEKSVDMAQPGRIYRLKFDKPVYRYAIFRRRINNTGVN